MDIRDIDLVVRWGVPNSTVDLWQEVGGCARETGSGLVHPKSWTVMTPGPIFHV